MVDGRDSDAQRSRAAPEPPRPTVFLSYATEDRPAAQVLRDALGALGVEVWYDESELGGGDAWDQKIRRQIRECDFFMPVVSAQTDARLEGYFRREWRLAVERTLDMADDHLFLLPVVVDDMDQGSARVPEKFLAVQWLRLPGGHATPALESLCRRLIAGETTQPAPRRTASTRTAAAKPDYPPFPVHGAGGGRALALAWLAWLAQTAWTGFRRLPRWVRLLATVWLFATLLSHGCRGARD
jgi:hypothetical protein